MSRTSTSGSELDPSITAVLRAVIDRIIPADAFPGAWDAGVGLYIQRQLGGDLARLAPLILAGLKALNEEAKSAHGLLFADLEVMAQDCMLERISSGALSTTWAYWFNMLIRLTNEGYYADPGNGGNREQVAWRMLGYQTRVPGRYSDED